MQTLDHDEVSVRIAARPEDVYAMVADVARTPEFSPEVISCASVEPTTGPVAGARFTTGNKVAGRPVWRNTPVVTFAERRASSPLPGLSVRRHDAVAVPVRSGGRRYPGDRVVRDPRTRSER